MSIQTELAKSVVSALIELYKLDMTPFGAGILYFTPNTVNGAANVSFGGQVYLPMPIVADGFGVSTLGAPPRPRLKVSNITKFIQPFLTENSDLVGAYVTRTLTLAKFLDSGSSPDGSQIISEHKLVIQQKVRLTMTEVEFILSSVVDAPSFKLPRGIVLRSEFPAAGLFRRS